MRTLSELDTLAAGAVGLTHVERVFGCSNLPITRDDYLLGRRYILANGVGNDALHTPVRNSESSLSLDLETRRLLLERLNNAPIGGVIPNEISLAMSLKTYDLVIIERAASTRLNAIQKQLQNEGRNTSTYRKTMLERDQLRKIVDRCRQLRNKQHVVNSTTCKPH